MNPQTATSASEKAMAGVGEHYHELHAGRRGHAAADEAMLRTVTFIRKLGERAHFWRARHPDHPRARDAEPARDELRCGEAHDLGLEHPRPGNPCRGLPTSPRLLLKSRVSRFGDSRLLHTN